MKFLIFVIAGAGWMVEDGAKEGPKIETREREEDFVGKIRLGYHVRM